MSETDDDMSKLRKRKGADAEMPQSNDEKVEHASATISKDDNSKVNFSTIPSAPNGAGPVVLHPTIAIQNIRVYTDEGKELFDLTARMEVSWVDRRFINWPLSVRVPADTWKPKFACLGPVTFNNFAEPATSVTPVVEDASTGMIQLAWVAVLKGEPVKFDETRLKHFPFDRLVINIFLPMFDNQVKNTPAEVMVKFRESIPEKKLQFVVGHAMPPPSRLQTPDFTVKEMHFGTYTYKANKQYYALEAYLVMQRNSAYFLVKGFVPLWITAVL